MRRLARSLPVLVPSIMLLVLLATRFYDPLGVLDRARRSIFDYYQRLEPRPYKPAPVVIVDIDNTSLAKMGQWPWPRTYIAQMVATLANAGAAAIAFDIVFAEPDRTSPASILPLWEAAGELKDSKSLLSKLPDHDALLADTIKQAGNVVAGFVLTPDTNDAKPPVRGTFAFAGDNPRAYLRNYPGAVINLPVLGNAAAGSATFSFEPDSDLVLRRVPLLLRHNNTLYPSLAAEALRVAQGAKTFIVKSAGASGEKSFGEHTGIVSVKIGSYSVPTDSEGRLYLHFTRPAPQRYLPAWTLFAPGFDPSKVEGKIVLVGTSAPGLVDLRPSPINPVMPGVEAHAQALEQILLNEYLLRPDWSTGAEWLFVLLLGSILILLLRTAGALWSAGFGLLAVVGAFAASWYLYTAQHFLIDPVTPSLAAFLVYLSGSLVGYLRTEAEKKQVRSAFSQYLSPALVEQLAADPGRLKLGGEMREMTFLFCDVRGFTTISEQFKSNPQGLTHLINQFLTPMTNIILARKGTIDKYMGDCIMAFWNAPLDDPDHANNACLSALAMYVELETLNARLRGEAEAEGRHYFPLNIGIGLNTGECVVGNMGSEQRFDYSVLGDAVNLASRLEGQSKTYGVDVVIGENTRARAPNWATLELDMIAVKGKKEAVRIFTLLGDETEKAKPGFQHLVDRHQVMLDAYRAQRWPEALTSIAECRKLDPRLGHLYDLYEERIAYYERNPPGLDWDGVFVATTK